MYKIKPINTNPASASDMAVSVLQRLIRQMIRNRSYIGLVTTLNLIKKNKPKPQMWLWEGFSSVSVTSVAGMHFLSIPFTINYNLL